MIPPRRTNKRIKPTRIYTDDEADLLILLTRLVLIRLFPGLINALIQSVIGSID
jgi:hypothetical protein